MSDIKKPSNLADESENQDLPAGAGQDPVKDKRKSGRIRKTTPLSSNEDQDLNEQLAPQEELASTDPDDLLADIRRSLVEEDVSKREKKQKGIFQRVARIIKPGKASSTEEPNAEESRPQEMDTAPIVEDDQKTIKTPAASSSGDENTPVAEADKTSEPDAESGSLENTQLEREVIEFMLGLQAEELKLAKSQDELPPQPELDENIIAEKTGDDEVHPTQPKREKIDERFENIREVALMDYEDSPLQPEVTPETSWRQTLRTFLRGLKPFERALLFGAVSLIFFATIIGFGFMTINAQVPEVSSLPTQALPVPVRVTLPGGWEFKLTKGKVENDKWSPRGSEWLEGTELCKWVALPWSLQLEAVVRTLKLNDPIELTMSNADQLQYKVQSIHNVPVDQIDTLDTATTCLLLILVNEDADTRWVVTAKP